MKDDEGWWRIKDEVRVFVTNLLTDEWMNKQTNICECRVAFVTEKANVNDRTLVVVDLEPRLSPEFCQDSHPSFCFLLEFSIDSNVLSKIY